MTSTNHFGTECIILSRVSTISQDYISQEVALKEYSKSLGYQKQHIISTKESGFKSFDKKEGFKLVIDCLNANPNCKTIFITELSRLSRYKYILFEIEHYLKINNIQLFVKDNNLKLFEDDGRLNESNQLMFSIFASLSESEMRTKKERFARGKKRLFAEGFSITGIPLFGYERYFDEVAKKNTYRINEKAAVQIKTVLNWYLNGIDGDKSKASTAKIAHECISKGFEPYLHKKRNINKLLKEKAYTGFKTTNNKHKNPEFWNYGNLDADKYVESSKMDIKYPKIIEDKLYLEIQLKLLSKNLLADKSTKHTTILSKLIICPNCGHFYNGEYRKKAYISHFYRCSDSRNTLNKCSNNKQLSMIMLDSVIWSYIKENIKLLVTELQERNKSLNINSIKSEIENLKDKIVEYETSKSAEDIILRNRIKTKSADTTKLVNDYERRINEIENQIATVDKLIIEKSKLLYEIESSFEVDVDTLNNRMTTIEKDKFEIQKYVRMLIKKIEVIKTNSLDTIIAIYKKNTSNDYSNISESKYLIDFIRIKKSNNKNVSMNLISNPNIFEEEHKSKVFSSIVLIKSHLDSKKDNNNIIIRDIKYTRFNDELYKKDCLN
jgi:DNA invertase Pin-like site-specific DNA recombinase